MNNDEQQMLISAIEATPPRPHHHGLLVAANKTISNGTFRYVFTQGGWFRLGGVLSADGCHLATELEVWVDSELEKCGNEFDEFLSIFTTLDLLVTRYAGRTHFFVAKYGPGPLDFLQLEVEEQQELLDRKLINTAQPPQDRTSLVEPVSPEKVDANPVGGPVYRFARLVDGRELVGHRDPKKTKDDPIRRFLEDWSESRAAEKTPLCDHWLISNLECSSPNVNRITSPKLMSVHTRVLKPFQWDSRKIGVAFGDQLRDFDRAAGYPSAWYFHLVARQFVPENLPENLIRDLKRGFAYMAEKDQKLLEKLVAHPYFIN